ncbi:uncharacterized protein LOC117225308 isoform X2 [Megalopta genalis]|uniref:uncharacterized protein LOC117225308 isoform X2 n=1 Tax=Megalopta genalis TaxID=115081 RepID=UPI001442F446|nr:uncharacterized protein LOC117225308 isoform X2 [Megalopta genalis]
MSSLQQGSRFLPFSNNNIQRKQLSMQGGLPQSLSGSETDVSTSNENLTNEDRYVIRHTARQEPQGQENQQQSPSRSSSHKENIPNIQGNVLNRNSLKDSLNGSNRNSLKENLNGSNRNSLKDSINGSNRNSLKDNLSNRTSVGSNRSSLDVSTSSYNTLIIHNANDDNSWVPSGRLSGVVREHGDMGYLYCDGGGKGHSNSPTMQSLSNLSHEDHVYEQPTNGGCQEITDIPDDYLSQSQVLKHLAKEVKVPSYSKLTNNGGNIDMRMRDGDRAKQNDSESEDRPPPSYMSVLLPLKNKSRLVGPMEKLTLSRSQPDLSRIGKPDIDNYNLRTTSPRPQTKGREETESATGEIWPPSEMIQIVIQENSALKLELERCYNKVAKSQKLEQEIAKVHRAHEELAASCERREKLERAARLRLQNDCRRLTELNRALRDQIDLLSARTDSPPVVESMRKELTQRELLIAQLITQNKELAAAKERQEIELAAQRATLQEQRTHIDILDTALTNAQGNVVRLEDESRKKQVYVDRVGQLQRALSSLQASCERREETERQLRLQLEQELRECGGGGGGINGIDGETIAELKRRIRERDEKIMSLEGDVAKWEQRYLEENALRQAAIDAASLPKDAKIAALEKTSQDAEKLIAEARSEKMRHMDEVHAAQKKLADLESRMKDLESKLAERDAMIRVLQKHTYDKDSSSSSGVGSYPAAHSSHSSTSAEHHNALTSTPELGFSNPGTASRKGKIPKPLLAGVDSTGTSSTASSKSRLLDDSGGEVSPSIMEFASAASRLKGTVSRLSDGKPEDMMLLEKQGRSSQRQRMQEGEPRRAGSLPPSSLPRPPKTLKSTNSRYCRLSDTEARKKSDPGPALDASASMKVRDAGNCSIEYGRFDTKAQRRKKSFATEPLVPSSVPKKPSTSVGHEYERLQGENLRKKQPSSTTEVKHRETQSRSLIPPPSRRIGEYGRLSEGTLRKQTGSRGQSTGSTVSSKSGGRDSGGTASSEASTSSLPPSKARSIPRPSNYRIQF